MTLVTGTASSPDLLTHSGDCQKRLISVALILWGEAQGKGQSEKRDCSCCGSPQSESLRMRIRFGEIVSMKT